MYRQLERNLLNSNTSSSCPYNMVNVGPLTPEFCWGVWSTPANFNVFCVLASLLHRHCSMEVNQTLHDVRLSPGLIQYIYTREGSCPLTEFWQVQNSLCVQILHSPILAALLCGGTRAVGVNQTLRRSAVGATYIRQGGHHVGHQPTF